MRRHLLGTAAIFVLAASFGGCSALSETGNGAAKTAQTKPAQATAASGSGSTPAATQNMLAGTNTTNLEDQIRAAQALRAKGDIAGAVRAFAQLVLIAPDDGRVVGEYGKSLVQQGRPADAVAFLKRATQLSQNDATVYSALGVAYDQLDDRKNAAAAYDRALVLHPGDPNVLNNYAVSRMLAGDFNGAQKLLTQAQATGTANPKIASNLQLLAQMRAQAAAKPAAPSTAAASRQAAGTTTGSQPKSIVMQTVPSDSHGQATTAKPARKTAATAKSWKPAKTAAKKITPPPTLRTADQGE